MANERTATVDLNQLVEELDGLFEGTGVYVNRRTAEIIAILMEDLSAVEDGVEDFEPESGEKGLAILRSIAEMDEWVAMPDQSDIHEWQIMSDFVDRVPGGRGDALARAIHGRGAFRMFRDAIDRFGMDDEWLAFKRQAIEEMAISALEAEGIPYHRAVKSSKAAPGAWQDLEK